MRHGLSPFPSTGHLRSPSVGLLVFDSQSFFFFAPGIFLADLYSFSFEL